MSADTAAAAARSPPEPLRPPAKAYTKFIRLRDVLRGTQAERDEARKAPLMAMSDAMSIESQLGAELLQLSIVSWFSNTWRRRAST